MFLTEKSYNGGKNYFGQRVCNSGVQMKIDALPDHIL
jgi:hypothetical protein